MGLVCECTAKRQLRANNSQRGSLFRYGGTAIRYVRYWLEPTDVLAAVDVQLFTGNQLRAIHI
jgi:hypothetical protein